MSRLLLRTVPFALALTLAPACGEPTGQSSADGALAEHAVADDTGSEHHTPEQVADAATHHAADDMSADDADAAGNAGNAKAALGDAWSTTPAGIALSAQIDAFIADAKIDTSASNWRTRLPKPPVFDMPSGAKITWLLQTNKGPMRVRLWQDVAPMHVASTLYLTRLGYFDELDFHRVIAGFMAQGGCPLGTGTSGPGYEFGGEFKPGVVHDRPGLLSMANRGPGTDGSQFFLTFAPTPWLDGKHTLFGVVEGEKSLATLRELEKRADPKSKQNHPIEPLIIEQAAYVVE